MVRCSAEEKILLHLKNYDSFRDGDEVPYEISQPGIAETLGLSRPYISKELRGLTEEDEALVSVDLRRVKGVRRKIKVYFLTEEGLEEEKKIRDELKEERITLKTEDAEEKIKLKDIDGYLDESEPLLRAISDVDQNGVLDLTGSEEEKEDPLVGRKRELRHLKDELKKVEEAGPSVIFISGEAGIGKTRLMEEFKEEMVEEGVMFLSGTCYFEGSDPYLPFKRVFQDLSEDEDVVIEDFFGGGDLDIVDEDMFNAERRATFYKTSKMVEELSQKRPLVIFIDDLHWAGEASLQLLYYMVDDLEGSSVLFIGTYRSQEAESNEAFLEIKQRMSKKGMQEEMTLDPLDREATKIVVKNTLSAEGIPERFIDVIHELSQGNPLFIREFSKTLLSEEVVDPEEGIYPKSKDEITIPALVDQIIDKRIDSLTDETKQVLKTGCVIGDEIPYELLKNISSMKELRLLDHIEILVERELWSEDPTQGIFRFEHALFRKVPLETMSTIRKKKLHSKVAESILEIYEEEIEDRYSDLALHYREAEERDKAIEYYLKAAEKAEKVYAYEDAVENYEKALELMSDPEMKVEALEKIADANRILGNYEESRRSLEKAMLITDDSKDHQRMYRKIAKTHERQGEFEKTLYFVKKGLSISETSNEEKCRLLDIKGWTQMQMGDLEKGKEIFEEMVELGKDIEDKRIVADALHGLGSLDLRAGEYRSALDHLSESIEVKREIGYERGLARSLHNKGVIYLYLGKLDKALDAYSRSIELEEKVGDKKLIATYLINLGNVYRAKGDLKTAGKKYQESFETSKKIGDKRGMCFVLNNLGDLSRIEGEFEEAMGRYEEAYELGTEIGLDQGTAQSLMNIGYVHMLKGDYEEAVSHHEEALEMLKDMGDIKSEARGRARLGKVYLKKRELKKAREYLEEAVGTYREIDEKVEIIDWMSHLSEVYLYLEEVEKALKQVEEALELAEELDSRYREIRSRCVHGMILREMGELQRARDEFKKALEIAQEKDKVVDQAKILYEMSVLFETMGESDRAKRTVEEALALSEEIGLKSCTERCEKLLADLEG